AVADIVGAPDLHIDEGSTLRLECKLKRATEYPDYVFWYHQESMVNFDQQNGFSVTPFQPVDSTALTDEVSDQPYPTPMDQSHDGQLHHGHGHHHHHHHHRNQEHHHRHHPRHHPHQLPPQDPTMVDDSNLGFNVLNLLNPAAVPSGSMSLLDAPLLDSGELLATDLTAGFSAAEEQLHQWALNQSGFLPYSHILSPATSVLTIKEVHSKHAGNYTCAPSNTRPASITVHVLQGKRSFWHMHMDSRVTQKQ
ncbi:probable nitrile hydratase, partial [Aedes aegypti]|uniref:Ig-like domain-containing protein n=1 Tax=Aedes aegypti TaxID=7159 RepID=A0A903VQC2_AEDAE